MVQERLEGLLLLSVECKTLLTLTKESIIDLHAHSSFHLSSALLCFPLYWTGALNTHAIFLQLHVKMTVTIYILRD